ncbi:hydroxypyruvate isomerase family protein [Oceanibium sediminis]|uniref:hydroxypyruvate isomerase family protein n=1 Tax=Oceanibium sediminis TaxID=2026339 RepID=UPI000DD3BD73|nr:TIM barrel protein [Oceanibium sediminis]
MRFSANLGFLWTDRPLTDRIAAAAAAGFDAVECHFPYDTDPGAVKRALEETGLSMLGLNTVPGDTSAGDFGLCALPGRTSEARAAIDQALEYASAIDCPNIHVMAGKSAGQAEAASTFRENLTYAVEGALTRDKTILIEPINTRDVPGYFLSTLESASLLIEQMGVEGLKIMFDCYHLQIMGGDLLRRYSAHAHQVGHIQFASVPDRGEPNRGEVRYDWLLPELAAAGYKGAFGAEYRPAEGTDTGLGWLATYKALG